MSVPTKRHSASGQRQTTGRGRVGSRTLSPLFVQPPSNSIRRQLAGDTYIEPTRQAGQILQPTCKQSGGKVFSYRQAVKVYEEAGYDTMLTI